MGVNALLVYCAMRQRAVLTGREYPRMKKTSGVIAPGGREGPPPGDAVATLYQSGTRFRTIVETANEGIWFIDRDARTVYANARMAAILGCTVDDILSRTVLDFCFPEDVAAGRARIERNFQGYSEQFDFRFRRADDSEVFVLACTGPIRDEAGEIAGALGMFTDITARTRAEEAMRASEEKFAAAFDLSPLLVSITSVADGRFVEVNESLVRASGYAREELLGRTPTEVGLWADPAAWAAGRAALREHQRITNQEARFRTKSGDTILGLLSAEVIALAAGPCILTVVTDITARKRVEDQQRLLVAAGAILGASLDYDDALRAIIDLLVPDFADWCVISTVDDGWVKRELLHHRDPEKELLLRAWPTRYHIDSLPDWGVPRVIRTGEPAFFPHGSAGKAVPEEYARDPLRPISLQLAATSQIIVPLTVRGRVIGVINVCLSRDDRHYDEADLALMQELARRAALALDNARLYQAEQTARDHLQRVLAVLPEAVVIADESRRFIASNPAAVSILGFDPTGLPVPMGPQEALATFGTRHLDGTPFQAGDLPMARALMRGEIVQGEQLLLRNAATGIDIPVLMNTAPLRQADGHVGAVAAFQDISAIRNLERERQAFLTTITHDLKNPLTVIRGQAQMAQIAAGRLPPPAGTALIDRLSTIVAMTSRIAAMINDLLDSARLQSGDPLALERQTADLVSLVQRAATATQSSGAGPVIRVEPALPSLRATVDIPRLERVIDNLLANAVKYSRSPGVVTVRVERERDAAGAWAVVTVSDQGLGIPAADLPHIFERFRRGANVVGRIAGTGLGLASARQIVEAHGGTIAAASEEGRGTIVTVRLPLG